MSAFDDKYSIKTCKSYWSPIRERPSVKAVTAIAFVWLMTSTMQYCSAQNLREWQSRSGSTLMAKLVGQSGDTVQLLDSKGKEYLLKTEKLSDVDRRYLKLQEIIPGDRNQFEAISKHLDGLKTAPVSTIEVLTKLAKEFPTAPYAPLWAGVAVAVARNEPERASTLFRDAAKRIKEQQKSDPSRHRRTLVAYHNNLAICYLKRKDLDSAGDEFLKAFELMEIMPHVLLHNVRQMIELAGDGAAFKLNASAKSKIVEALAKHSKNLSKVQMQPGWYFSLDLQPPDSLGSELAVLGISPPNQVLEIIASGSGIVCAPGHILTVRPNITNPNRPASLITIAVAKQDASWVLTPVQRVIEDPSASELAMLVVDQLDLKPAYFVSASHIPTGELMILGHQRGPEILQAGMKSEKGDFQGFEDQNKIFKTSAVVGLENRGGACVDPTWRVVGLAWHGETGNSSKGVCYSVDAIRDWMGLYVQSVSLNTATGSGTKEQRDSLRRSVVPILVWGKNQDLQDSLYSRFQDEGNLNDLLVIRDEWCVTCSGKSFVGCRVCRGTRQVQTGTTKVQAAFDQITRTPIFVDVPTKSPCETCQGVGKLRCPHCKNGKLEGGPGIAKR